MMNTLNFREQGNGPTVILIHGFPMNQSVWNDFSVRLSEKARVVTFDLPGFGESPGLPENFSLYDVAKTVLAWIRGKKYSDAVIVGHSLGGYVTLAIAEQDKNIAGGICLFHSTALADSEDKKQSRNKTLDFIEKQGVQAYTSNFIAQLYADPRHSSIAKVRNIAAQSSKEAVMGYTRAMRDRKDQTELLSTFPRPILFLAGEKDQAISAHSIVEQAALNKKAEATLLPDVAHMGMFESQEPCLKNIFLFIEKCSVTS